MKVLEVVSLGAVVHCESLFAFSLFLYLFIF